MHDDEGIMREIEEAEEERNKDFLAIALLVLLIALTFGLIFWAWDWELIHWIFFEEVGK